MHAAAPDAARLQRALAALRREHVYWTAPPKQVALQGADGRSHLLSRYYAAWDQPRPESYRQGLPWACLCVALSGQAPPRKHAICATCPPTCVPVHLHAYLASALQAQRPCTHPPARLPALPPACLPTFLLVLLVCMPPTSDNDRCPSLLLLPHNPTGKTWRQQLA